MGFCILKTVFFSLFTAMSIKTSHMLINRVHILLASCVPWHVRITFTCHPPALLGPSPQSCSPAVPPQSVLVHGVVPPQVQDPALALVEIHQIPLCPTLQPVQVTLNGSTACRCIHHSSQFGVISKLAEGILYPFIQVIDEEVE